MQKAKFTEAKFIVMFIFITSLFMLWGIVQSISDALNKHFQNVLNVPKAQSGLIQMSVFGAYLVMSIPAGLFMKRFGYKMGVLLGLILFAGGTFLFVPAANENSFGFFRIALFILGCGIATLEIVAHPFAAALGDQRTSNQRVNFAQSFNAVGAVVGPLIRSYFLLRATDGSGSGMESVKLLYVGLGVFITLVAVVFLVLKVPALTNPHAAVAPELDAELTKLAVPPAITSHDSQIAINFNAAPGKPFFKHRHFVWAAIAQFFNVAAQAGTWTFFINYSVEYMYVTDATAANYFSIFMACMAAGRFAGTYLLKFIAPNKLLALFALGNIGACIIVSQHMGWGSYLALFSINFFFSIMFPTIFSLGLKNLGKHTQQASSFIPMGVVGGAVMPYFKGKIANYSIATSYYLPILCYILIFLFGAKFTG